MFSLAGSDQTSERETVVRPKAVKSVLLESRGLLAVVSSKRAVSARASEANTPAHSITRKANATVEISQRFTVDSFRMIFLPEMPLSSA